MTIFSFRAECQSDVDNLHQIFTKTGIVMSMEGTQDDKFPDVEIELNTSASLEDIRNAMRAVEDGHVMLQTLRACPLSENSLERDYDLECD